MARRDKSLLRLDAVRVEGALIQPDILALVAAGSAEGQTAESYGIPAGLNLRDEIGRAFQIAKAHWAQFEAGREGANADAVHRAFVRNMLTQVLGFDLPAKRHYETRQGGALDLLNTPGGRVPVCVAGPGGIDEVVTITPAGGDPLRRSASTLVQGELNAHDKCLWGMATNGVIWRVLRDNESITRPGFVEVDLGRVFRDDLYSDFRAFWLVCHASRFGHDEAAGSDCSLERWRQLGREQGVTAREDLRDGVQKALFQFGRGFLENPANAALVARLNETDPAKSPLSREAFFNELLRLVYRLIFVMTAEDRDILHAPEADEAARLAYSKGYATGRLRERSRNRLAWDRHHDAYEGMKIVFRSLAHGEKRLGLPALGGIFADDQTPDLDGARMLNKRFLNGLYNLAWLRREGSLARINWRDMETEEFGSVYESLLELVPVVSDGGRKFSFLGEPDDDKLEGASQAGNGTGGARGNERKKTGSYYTPDSLVQLLLDQALDPVIEKMVAENPDDPEALLKIKFIDPACGSGHFVLGAARRIAKKLAHLRHEGAPTIADQRHALRDVARHCLHGVDRNPMAIELCKVAVWIETVEPGKPLTFIDQKLRCGDSLVGVFDFKALAKGVPDEAYAKLSGDTAEAASHYKRLNKLQRDGSKKDGKQQRLPFADPPADLVEKARLLDNLPEDSLDEIEDKRTKYKDWMETGWDNQKRACDLWTSAFFVPKRDIPRSEGDYEVPLTDHVWLAWSGSDIPKPMRLAAEKLAKDAAFLHWPLVFPDVLNDGGFDCVVGNPPWERIKLQEQEFFASRDSEIASAANTAARGRLITALSKAAQGSAKRHLFEEFEQAKRTAEGASVFARVPGQSGGRFDLTGRGDVNTYSLFSEHFLKLAGGKGRAGIIVPTGIATDATTASFFAALIEEQRLATLFDFENRNRLFPAVDSRMKFCLLSTSQHAPEATFAFFLSSPDQINETERRFTLKPASISKMNPNTKTAPVFRSKRDAELTGKIYSRFSVLHNDDGTRAENAWGMSFHSRIWHMSEDSHWFRTSTDLRTEGYVQDGPGWAPAASSSLNNDGRYIPLYEAKMLHQFDHRWSTYEGDGETSRDVTLDEKRDPSFEPRPRYWVPEAEVVERLKTQNWKYRWLLGWRDICRATDERTLIADVAPAVATNDKFLLMFPAASSRQIAALYACLNSLVVDYVARQKLGGTSFKLYLIKQLPVPLPSDFSTEDLEFIVSRVVKLTFTSSSMSAFATDLGYKGRPFTWDDLERATLRAELDAFFARAYGLTRDELCYILDPTQVAGAAYPSETFRVLKNNEIKACGEYRTARLVLEAWDRMETKKRNAA